MATSAITESEKTDRGIAIYLGDSRGQALTLMQVRDRLPKKPSGEWSIRFVRALMNRLGGFKFARTLYLYERDLDTYIAGLTSKAETDGD